MKDQFKEVISELEGIGKFILAIENIKNKLTHNGMKGYNSLIKKKNLLV